MRRACLIAGRELDMLFSTPSAYVVLLLFQLLNGMFFSAIVYSGAAGTPAYLYRNIALVLLLMAPAVVMGAFVGEKRAGTLELLLTSPVSPVHLVAGKALAYLVFAAVMCLTTLQYPVMLSFFCVVDWGRILAGTLGVFLLAQSMMALGLLCSALVEHRLWACLLAFTGGLMFWCARSLVRLVTGSQVEFVRSLSFYERLLPFTVGLVDSGDVVFFLSFAFAGLFLCLRVVQSWRNA